MEEKEFDYMNVIPLVDVMLVLLTIVLTTSTFVATGVVPVELPGASRSHNDALKSQTIEIDKKGNVYLNTKQVTLDGLKKFHLFSRQVGPMLIRADRDIALQMFVDVLDTVKNLGFRKVSLQTEQRRN